MGNLFSREPAPLNPEEEAIHRFVNTLFANHEIRVGSRIIEKDVLLSLMRVLMGSLHEILGSVRIEFMDHVITMRIDPLSPATASS